MTRIVSCLVAACLLLLLAACGNTGVDELTGLRLPDVKTSVDGDGVAYGVAFLMVDSTFLGPTSLQALSSNAPEGELSPLGMTEVDPGIYLGQLAEIDSSGNTTLNLPHPDDIPGIALVNASDAFANASSALDCTVKAEPADVQMTVNTFSGFTIPGFMGLAITPSNSSPIARAVLSDKFLDIDTPPDNYRVYHWIYSDGATAVSFEGTDCGNYSASQVDFQAGWNLVAWDVDQLAPSAELVNVERPETFFLTIEGDEPTP